MFFIGTVLLVLLPAERAAGRPAPVSQQIPVVENPEFIPASAARFLEDEELVLGVVLRGEARAYPIRILGLYEVINDRLADTAVSATW